MSRFIYWNVEYEVSGRLVSSQAVLHVRLSLEFFVDIRKSFRSLKFMREVIRFVTGGQSPWLAISCFLLSPMTHIHVTFSYEFF